MEPQSTGMKLPMWAKVLMALVTVVLLALGTIYLLGIVERGRWERYAATLRAAGEPLTFKEIEARRTVVPDDRNSVLVIEAALEKFPPDHDPPPGVLLWDRPSPKRNIDLVEGIPRYAIEDSRTFLEKHRPLLDALEPVMDMPTGRMAIAYAKNPYDTMLRDFSGLRTAVKLARLDSILRLVDGDPDGAVDGTILQLHIAGSLNEHPTLIIHFVEMASDRLGLKTAEDVLLADELPEDTLVRLHDALAARRRTDPMRWGMWSERTCVVELDDLLVSGEVKVTDLDLLSVPGLPSELNLIPEFMIRRNQLLAVEMWTWLVDAGKDLPAMRRAAVRMETAVNQLGNSYFLTRVLTPSMIRAVTLQMEHNMVLECTLAGIAAERYRLVTGRLPASLDDLVPAYLESVPIDLFAEGQPIKLVATDQGIVIYSIGDDSVDDNGDVVPEEKQRNGSDLGFRLLDPEHRRVVITDEPRPGDD